MTKYLILALTALAALVAAGCGGTEATGDVAGTQEVQVEDFDAAAQEARDEVDAALRDLRDVRNPSDLAGALAVAADRVTDATELVERTDAPRIPVTAKEDFVQALEDFANELEQTARNLEEGDVDNALDSVRGLDSLEHLREAIADLREAGVDVRELR